MHPKTKTRIHQTLKIGLTDAITNLAMAIHHLDEYKDSDTNQWEREEIAETINALDATHIILDNLETQVKNLNHKLNNQPVIRNS
jgi:hypothetical protein